MTRRRYERPVLLLRVMAALGAGRIYEAPIRDLAGCVTEGFCETARTSTKSITIDPACVIEVLLHELLHRLEPSWSERYVANRTTWLLHSLTQAQVHAIYREYDRRRRKRKRVVTVEA